MGSSRARVRSQLCGSDTAGPGRTSPRQPVLLPREHGHLGLHEGPQNWHQLLILQVLGVLDGHVQDVDGLFAEVLGGNKVA